jgi:hypothetical protein
VVRSDPRSRKWIYVLIKRTLARACIQELPYNFDHKKEEDVHASIAKVLAGLGFLNCQTSCWEGLFRDLSKLRQGKLNYLDL